MSNQEKSEHQRVLKDFEKQIATVNTLKEQKERLEDELRVSFYGTEGKTERRRERGRGRREGGREGDKDVTSIRLG